MKLSSHVLGIVNASVDRLAVKVGCQFYLRFLGSLFNYPNFKFELSLVCRPSIYLIC